MNRERVTPALGDRQARAFLEAPPADTLKGQRDRAILATLLYHGLRCEELCTLTVGSIHQREGVPHIRVEGKGDKVRYLPLHVTAQRLIAAYLQEAKHAEDLRDPLFRPVKNNRTRTLAKPLHLVSVYPGYCEALCPRGRPAGGRPRPVCPFPACHRRHQCPLQQCRHRQGAGVAEAQ
jgi:integrase/recombinase XerD